MANILLLNGPNLNLLGTRQPAIYGHKTLEEITAELQKLAKTRGHELRFAQSNEEATLLNLIHEALEQGVDFILINPGAFAHTSIALRDAFSGTAIPFIEIHISNIHQRESFRHHSYLAEIAIGTICGLGTYGYELGLLAAIQQLETN